jgi:hypothetical protein
MMKKIRFYKKLLIEIIETLCTICLYLEYEGRKTHNKYSRIMIGHFEELKTFSESMRKKEQKVLSKEPYVQSTERIG